MDCHQSFDPECMDLDHRDPSQKLFAVGYGLIVNNETIDKVMAEIDKCDLVCANCHKLRTKRRRMQ